MDICKLVQSVKIFVFLLNAHQNASIMEEELKNQVDKMTVSRASLPLPEVLTMLAR